MNALEAEPQGSGVGTKLIEAAERLAHSAGGTVIGLAVERGNTGARRLYAAGISRRTLQRWVAAA
jgi:ribosomal protein S18 acetylase RimI-like enzyme